MLNYQINIILPIYSWYHESNQLLYLKAFRLVPLIYSVVMGTGQVDDSVRLPVHGPWLDHRSRTNTWWIEVMHKTQKASVWLLHCSGRGLKPPSLHISFYYPTVCSSKQMQQLLISRQLCERIPAQPCCRWFITAQKHKLWNWTACHSQLQQHWNEKVTGDSHSVTSGISTTDMVWYCWLRWGR